MFFFCGGGPQKTLTLFLILNLIKVIHSGWKQQELLTHKKGCPFFVYLYGILYSVPTVVIFYCGFIDLTLNFTSIVITPTDSRVSETVCVISYAISSSVAGLGHFDIKIWDKMIHTAGELKIDRSFASISPLLGVLDLLGFVWSSGSSKSIYSILHPDWTSSIHSKIDWSTIHYIFSPVCISILQIF